MNKKLPHISPQTAFFVGFVFIILFVLCSCSSTPVTKVDLMVPCDDGLSPSLLTEPCAKSQALSASAVYQNSLKANKDTNQSLNDCSVKAEKLQEAFAKCHTAVVNHNAVIQAIAAPTAKK